MRARVSGRADALLALRQPALLATIEFDDEADGLALWARTRAPLLRVAELITDAKETPELLAAAIAEAVKAERME